MDTSCICCFCKFLGFCHKDECWTVTCARQCDSFSPMDAFINVNFDKEQSGFEIIQQQAKFREIMQKAVDTQLAKKDGGKPHPSYVTEKERSQISFMTSDTFESICEEQMNICRGVLFNKAKEYAQNDDRLHNFRSAAGMTGDSMQSALSGMMLKHTISVYDMCRSRDTYPLDLWTEKITDHINYLLLLKAVVVEEAGNP